jgi:peptidoglycan/LPS O-acetylase OafA/YrhL
VRTRISEIDFLRFLAAVAVMLMHYLIRGFAQNDLFSPMHFPTIGPYTRYNYLAVDLFFIISGFMIMMSIHQKNNQLISPKGFILSRFLRLYPAYWLCCTLSFLLVFFILNDIFKVTIFRYILNMTMLNGFIFVGNIDGVYWTLCIELKFYLFMLLLLYLKQIPNIHIYLIVWSLISAINYWVCNQFVKYLFFTDYAPFFISGCLFFLCYKVGFNWIRSILLGINFVFGFIYEKNLLVEKYLHFITLSFNPINLFLILAFFYLLFIIILQLGKSEQNYDTLFSNLGKLSYPLYLIHFNLGMIIFNLFYKYVNWYLLVGLTSLIMILLAHLISTYFEKPFAKFLKQKLSPWASS